MLIANYFKPIIEAIEDIVSYFGDNKEWIFSGIGVPVTGFIYGFIAKKKRDDKKQNKQSSILNFGSNVTQIIKNNTEKD